MRRSIQYLCALAVLAAVSAPAAAGSGICHGHREPGVRCQPGHARQSAGGGHKASHLGWPAITGILLIVIPGTRGHIENGTDSNDELLGSHGSDVINGGPGDDVIWGDQLPSGNDTWQHDTLIGGPGDDWIYSSHGYNVIYGGPGNDHIWAHFGRGIVDCGPGYDVVHVKRHSTYRLRNCEKVLHN